MVPWNDVETVKRNGKPVVKETDGHKMLKIYRLKNGSRIRQRGVSVGVNEDIPKEERKFKTSWKCEQCGVETGSVPKNISSKCE